MAHSTAPAGSALTYVDKDMHEWVLRLSKRRRENSFWLMLDQGLGRSDIAPEDGPSVRVQRKKMNSGNTLFLFFGIHTTDLKKLGTPDRGINTLKFIRELRFSGLLYTNLWDFFCGGKLDAGHTTLRYVVVLELKLSKHVTNPPG